MNFATLLSYDRYCREERQIENSVLSTAEGKEYYALRQALSDLKDEMLKLKARNEEIDLEIAKYKSEYKRLLDKYEVEAEDAERMQQYDDSAEDSESKTEAAEYRECRTELEKIKHSVKGLCKKVNDLIHECEKNLKRIDEARREGATKMEAFESAKKRFSAVKNAQKSRLDSIAVKKRAAETTLREKEPVLWAKYQSILVEKSDPIAVIVDGGCGGCGFTLPKNTNVKVTAGELVICENCGRIIVIK